MTHLVQIIDALDPICNALAIFAWVLNSCNLGSSAAARTCLHNQLGQSDIIVIGDFFPIEARDMFLALPEESHHFC